jgi:hypothetical protein
VVEREEKLAWRVVEMEEKLARIVVEAEVNGVRFVVERVFVIHVVEQENSHTVAENGG